MHKYMLTIQHEEQKVAYINFVAKGDVSARKEAEILLDEYNQKEFIIQKFPNISANFYGVKPKIVSTHLSKWKNSETATNAWGLYCGGYWKDL